MRVNPVTMINIKKSYNLVHFIMADASPHPDDVSLLLVVSISTAHIVSESRVPPRSSQSLHRLQKECLRRLRRGINSRILNDRRANRPWVHCAFLLTFNQTMQRRSGSQSLIYKKTESSRQTKNFHYWTSSIWAVVLLFMLRHPLG